MKVSPILAVTLALACLVLPACEKHEEEHTHQEHHKLVLTSPMTKDVTVTQQYVCQIRSQQYIEVCALVGGRLEEITVREGQAVKKGDPMFKILPTLYQAKWDAEMAEVHLAKIEYDNTKRLNSEKPPVVSDTEVALYEAKLAKAQATANRTKAEVDFTVVRAPFDGIVDRLQKQLGSTIKEGEILTTLSDNSMMWVYYNVPEAHYLRDMAHRGENKYKEEPRIDLLLADGSRFEQTANKVVTIEGKFNNETGNIPYRADFPNPDRLLRHGQTGNIQIHRTQKNALVIPQRATFETLDKRYVYVVGKDNVIRQREIVVQNELEDIFVIKRGLEASEKIILEGVRQVRDGEKAEDVEFRPAEEAIANQKKHAE